jgi:hypothetical protein
MAKLKNGEGGDFVHPVYLIWEYCLLMKLGTIYILRKGTLVLFRPLPLPYVNTFSLHEVIENCHFLNHHPSPMSLRNT